MKRFTIFALFILFIVTMDFYALRGIRYLIFSGQPAPGLFLMVYWGITAILFIFLLRTGQQFYSSRDPAKFFGMTLVVGIFLMLYTSKLLFNGIQLAGDLVTWIASHLNRDRHMSRSWYLIPGAIAGMIIFLAFGMGMLHGRTYVKVFRHDVGIRFLPLSFHGLKVVQLSDMHLAGFYHHPQYIRDVVEQVNMLEPDLIFFTGDLVHNFAEEADPFVEILRRLHAPLGKFAVLGNHDYGKYFKWNSGEEEAGNLVKVKEQIRACGFDLLLNEFRTITLNGDSLEILGVENWGKPPFPRLGNLSGALEGTQPGTVKILLSHDPSHWEQEVCSREQIQLTLSGHTHGMQFGIEMGKFRWSPSRWTYKHWGGLYRENSQYLYVNRGLGFTGFPGRVGIRPEITLLTLTALTAG